MNCHSNYFPESRLTKLRVSIVEADPISRQSLAQRLRRQGCKVVHTVPHAQYLLAFVEELIWLDALFVDAKSFAKPHWDWHRTLLMPPPIVLMSEMPIHAFDAMEGGAIDFLNRPHSELRLRACLQKLSRAKEYTHWLKSSRRTKRRSILVMNGNTRLLLETKKITHLEFRDRSVWIWSGGNRFRAPWRALDQAEEFLQSSSFIRIQRNLLLRVESVRGISPLAGGRGRVRISEGIEFDISRIAKRKLCAVIGL